jgi:hypothetical protein
VERLNIRTSVADEWLADWLVDCAGARRWSNIMHVHDEYFTYFYKESHGIITPSAFWLVAAARVEDIILLLAHLAHP